MYTLTYGQLTKEFNVSRLIATLGLSMFVAGLGLGPMVNPPTRYVRCLHANHRDQVLAPLSEV